MSGKRPSRRGGVTRSRAQKAAAVKGRAVILFKRETLGSSSPHIPSSSASKRAPVPINYRQRANNLTKKINRRDETIERQKAIIERQQEELFLARTQGAQAGSSLGILARYYAYQCLLMLTDIVMMDRQERDHLQSRKEYLEARIDELENHADSLQHLLSALPSCM
jgi:hypothetical protein